MADEVKLLTVVDGVPRERPVVPVVAAALPAVPLTAGDETRSLHAHLDDLSERTAPFRGAGGSVPYQFPTIAAAAAAVIPAGVRLVHVAGAVEAGIGAADLRPSLRVGPTPGLTQFRDGTWWEVVPAGLSVEMLGGGTGVAAQDALAIQSVKGVGDTATVGTALQPVGIGDLDSYFNTTFEDDGSGKGALPGLYGKWVIPRRARDAGMAHAGDLIASAHCPVSIQCASAVEVLIGDSLSTYQANTLFRGNMFATALERELRAQAGDKPVAFYPRAIGGGTLATYLSDVYPTFRPERPAWWAANVPGKRGIDFVRDLQPTRLWVSVGMNFDGSTSITQLESLVAIVRSWPFPCDIVLVTNLLPRPMKDAGNPQWNTIAEQEARHDPAGLTRSYARWKGLGLLDPNRKMMRAVHGQDPTETALVLDQSFAPATNGFAGTRACHDFKATIEIDTAQIPADNSTPITFRTGSGSDDYITLTRTTGTNAYNLTCVTGHAGDNLTYLVNAPVTITPNNGTRVKLCFERYGSMAMLYREGVAADAYGEFSPHLWSGKIIARGGRYVPLINAFAPGVILSGRFDYGVPALCRPSVSLDDLYGKDPFGPRGGSGYNHPGSLIDQHVYGPVLRAAQLFAGDPFRRMFPFTMAVRGSAGENLRYIFDNNGFTARDGDLISWASVRISGQYYFDRLNPAPRMYQGDGTVTLAAGTTIDTAYYIFAADGTFLVPNGKVKAQGLIGTAWPSSPAGLQPGEVWRDAANGGVLKAV